MSRSSVQLDPRDISPGGHHQLSACLAHVGYEEAIVMVPAISTVRSKRRRSSWTLESAKVSEILTRHLSVVESPVLVSTSDPHMAPKWFVAQVPANTKPSPSKAHFFRCRDTSPIRRRHSHTTTGRSTTPYSPPAPPWQKGKPIPPSYAPPRRTLDERPRIQSLASERSTTPVRPRRITPPPVLRTIVVTRPQ